jgi:hypothetical protein
LSNSEFFFILSYVKYADLVLQSSYSPEVCLKKLGEEIDPPRRTIFSFSGYRGTKPVILTSGAELLLRKRRYWRNDFGPVLYARIITDGGGARVEAYWGIQRWTRIFMRIWLIIAALIGTPIFVASLRQFITGKPSIQGDLYLGLLVPPGMLLFGGVLLPKLGSLLGLHERRYLVGFLERVLVAQTIQQRPEREWRSSLE